MKSVAIYIIRNPMARLRLGTHGLNLTLRAQHIFTDRTARQSTIDARNAEQPGAGIRYCQELAWANLRDLLTIIKWTAEHGIYFYRMSSGLFPHLTNPRYIKGRGYQALAYPLEPFRPLLEEIGHYAKSQGVRLTFHPGQYTLLNPVSERVKLASLRDLHWHCSVLDMMGLDLNSVCVIHGGGIYDDKPAAMERWVVNYQALPAYIRERIVLENDEIAYSIEDVLTISRRLKKSGQARLPIVLDLFHYLCYNQYMAAKGGQPLPSLIKYLPEVIETWGDHTIKMHYSEQRPGASFGAHSDYLKALPPLLLNFPKKYHRNLDLMIEAKAGEKAVLRLKKKYNL